MARRGRRGRRQKAQLLPHYVPGVVVILFFAALARIRAASKRLRVERTREVTIARDKLACFYGVLRVSVLLCVSYARILTLNPVLYRWYIRAHN